MIAISSFKTCGIELWNGWNQTPTQIVSLKLSHDVSLTAYRFKSKLPNMERQTSFFCSENLDW